MNYNKHCRYLQQKRCNDYRQNWELFKVQLWMIFIFHKLLFIGKIFTDPTQNGHEVHLGEDKDFCIWLGEDRVLWGMSSI